MNDFMYLRKKIKDKESIERKVKIALLGDTATQFLAMAIVGEGASRGYNVDLFEGDYNQIEQQINNPSSALFDFDANYTIIFQSTHKLLEEYSLSQNSEWSSLASMRIESIRNMLKKISGRIIYFNYPEIDDGVFGSYANKTSDAFTYQIRKLNYELMLLTQEYSNLYICDLSSIQNKYGRDYLFDPALYISSDMILSIDSLPIVSSRIMDIVCSLEGHFSKCLILDLDNTLWGGIVGDDGWEKIQIGHGFGIGKAFTEFQEWIIKLKKRGIIICICSKNDEEKAKEPFVKNPEMILKLDDVSVFIANWENKADNIITIQKILNIGFDSMVFLDDNPFERSLVKEKIPDIKVPELPNEPEKYLEYLYSINLFETTAYSLNDNERTKQYQIEAKRVQESQKYNDISDFLKSLKMTCIISGFDPYVVPRIAQLSQRSNQFNLRTIRYTEDQIKDIEQNNGQVGFAFELKDRFGDNGIIAAVVLDDCIESEENVPLNFKKAKETLFIETWFMSCRVLKRGMEYFMLNTVVRWAQNNGYKRLVGEYLPTPKNNMVANFYNEIGFKAVDNSKTSQWELYVDTYKEKECYILELAE